MIKWSSRRAGVATVMTVAATLAAVAASPAHAQSRTRVAGGFGIAAGAGDLGDLTDPGAFGTIGLGFPRGDRFTFWLEGSAEGLAADTDPLIEQGDWQYSTRYLAAAEYRLTRPWSQWRLSATLGAGATTFWDNSWSLYSIGEDGLPDYETVANVTLSGTHFAVAPGFRAAYAVAPNLDVELLGRAHLTFAEGEVLVFDAGAGLDFEPPGSPITSWGLSLGTRLRTGGAPVQWSDLEPGDPVRVWSATGHELEGRFVALEGRRVRVLSDAGMTEMDLVELEGAATRYTKADGGGLIGAAALGGVGALLGGLAGGIACETSELDSGCASWVGGAAALGLTGALAGFVVGSLLGGLDEKWRDLPVR